MPLPNNSTADEYALSLQTSASAVSWSAILAGATAAAALALILLMLGTGLGLSSVSPWAYSGVSATTFGVSSILWLTFTQLAASGMGGYLAGRLRTRWIAVHTDEVYLRDTAHGFLAWAVAALLTAALLTGASGFIVSGGVQAGTAVAASVAGGVATGVGAEAAKSDSESESMGYFVDSLFRREIGTTPYSYTSAESDSAQKARSVGSASEIIRIFMNSIHTGPLPAEDVQYVGQVVALRTGTSQQDAEKLVRDTYARAQTMLHDAEIAAKEAADKMRKTSAYMALWFFISLLIGAFAASYAAIFGGQQRDMY
ncbi:hypothetical protein [Methylotuvimicrobium buryatense]|uniref:Transmembrane protein n=1 Tax=Methylotuvimicrobium buryatense TaxID=95641 RepID=A0A4P9UPL7_METBY|nr:hypothetical protein [Methylotuvimicrobium buryatense]QCW83344.1 hypothetical protein EQU24_14655 [Methylotuvimicrobium buryatense]